LPILKNQLDGQQSMWHPDDLKLAPAQLSVSNINVSHAGNAAAHLMHTATSCMQSLSSPLKTKQVSQPTTSLIALTNRAAEPDPALRCAFSPSMELLMCIK
jgi:hypothetical protein